MHPDMSEHFLGYLNQLLGVASSEQQSKANGVQSQSYSVKASDMLDAVRLSLARNLARVGVMQAGIA